jgi:hypothetical protein
MESYEINELIRNLLFAPETLGESWRNCGEKFSIAQMCNFLRILIMTKHCKREHCASEIGHQLYWRTTEKDVDLSLINTAVPLIHGGQSEKRGMNNTSRNFGFWN